MGGWIWADRRGLVSEALRLRGLATTAAVTMRSGMLEHPAVLRPLAVQAEVLLPPPGIPRSCRRPFQFLSRLMARRDSTGIWVTSRLDHGSNPRRRSAICGARFSSERGFERRAVLVHGHALSELSISCDFTELAHGSGFYSLFSFRDVSSELPVSRSPPSGCADGHCRSSLLAQRKKRASEDQ